MTPALTIVRDDASPLWVVRCAAPCGRRGARWCQGADYGLELCWLGSSLTREGAEAIRERLEQQQ